MVKTAQAAVRKPAPAKQSTAVVKKQSEGQLPAFMRQDVGRGAENIDTSDLEQPRLKLMQATSKELDSYDSLRPGMFFHVAMEHTFDKPIRVVPIFFAKRYLLWNPLDSGGGILARADDAKHWSPANQTFDVKLDKKYGGKNVKWRTARTVDESGLANWGTMDPNDPNSPPAATLMYDYLFGFPDFPDLLPAVFTFQRSAIKPGKKFNTRLKTLSARNPVFGLVFELSSEKASNAVNQQYFLPSWVGAGDLRDNQALYEEYRDLHTSLSESGLRVKDEEELQTEDQSDDEPEDEPAASGRAKPRF